MSFKKLGEKKNKYIFIVLVILTFLFIISLNLFLWIKITFWCRFVPPLQLCCTPHPFGIITNVTSLYYRPNNKIMYIFLYI